MLEQGRDEALVRRVPACEATPCAGVRTACELLRRRSGGPPIRAWPGSTGGSSLRSTPLMERSGIYGRLTSPAIGSRGLRPNFARWRPPSPLVAGAPAAFLYENGNEPCTRPGVKTMNANSSDHESEPPRPDRGAAA